MSFFAKLFTSDKDKEKAKEKASPPAAAPAAPVPISPRPALAAPVKTPPPQASSGNNPMLMVPSPAGPAINRPPVPQPPPVSGAAPAPTVQVGDGAGSDRSSSVVFNTSNSFGNTAGIPSGALPPQPSRSQSLAATPRGDSVSQGPPPGWGPNPGGYPQQVGMPGGPHQGAMYYGPPMQQGNKGPPMMVMMRGKGPMMPPQYAMHGPPQHMYPQQGPPLAYRQQQGGQWVMGPPQPQRMPPPAGQARQGSAVPVSPKSASGKSFTEVPSDAVPKPISPKEPSPNASANPLPAASAPAPAPAPAPASASVAAPPQPSGERTPPTAETTQLPESPVPSPAREVAGNEAAVVSSAQAAPLVQPEPAPALEPISTAAVSAVAPLPAAPSALTLTDEKSPSHGTEIIHAVSDDSDESDIQFAEEEPDEEIAPSPPVVAAATRIASGTFSQPSQSMTAAAAAPVGIVREASVDFPPPPVRRVDTAEPPPLPVETFSVASSRTRSNPSSPKSPAIAVPATIERPRPAIPPLSLTTPVKEQPVPAQPAAHASKRNSKREDQLGNSSAGAAPVAPAARQRIINQFLSILCPQQYAGKVVRLHSIRPASAPSALPVTTTNKIFVVSFPQSSSLHDVGATLYYPQVRLTTQDAAPSPSTPGLLETSCVLHEATLGLMSFAETVQEASSMVLRGACDSCFVTSVSAIVLASNNNSSSQKEGSSSGGVANVTRVASLVVEWRPHSTPASDTLCQVHNCPMELFDLNRKELLCALCNAKTGPTTTSANNARRVCVLSEMLTKDNAHSVESTFKQRLEELSEAISRNIQQHQRLTHLGAKRRDAINHQFNLFIAAVEAKREEFLEASSAEFASSTSAASKEILVADEQVCMIKAAIEHLKAVTGPGAPPPGTPNSSRFLQIATVAQALQTVKETPVARKGPHASGVTNTRIILPNLEGALGYIQQLPLTSYGTSPFNLNESRGSNDRSMYSPPQQRRGSPIRSKSAGGNTPGNNNYRTPGDRKALADEYRQQRRSSPRRERQQSGAGADSLLYAVPGKNGTCLFNCPLQGMIDQDKAVQWTLRVDDPGDWVGVGVGVGGSIEQWHTGQTFDLSHLWIVSPRMPKTLVLRITAISNGNAKLSIYDKRGKQLDDGRIAHWNVQRPCFPQVSFGGRNGKVTMIQTPHTVAL